MNLVDELHAIAGALSTASIPYAVCGGVAVTMHGAPRTTVDIDILLARAASPISRGSMVVTMPESDMSPAAVSRRLAILRTLWRPLDRDQARRMMEPPRPTERELTPAVVARRLAELRALVELNAYLGGSARDGSSGAADRASRDDDGT